MQFTFNGERFEGRKDHVGDILALVGKCESVGSADPPDIQNLQETIEAQSGTIEGLQAEAEKKNKYIQKLTADLAKAKKKK